jgi:drug/metabolite transporter (DMT)-like permease
MRNARAELALAVVTIIWGATFVVVKSALAEVSTYLFLALRFTLAALVLGVLYRRSVRRQSFAAGLLAGCLLFAAYVFQTLGLELTTPSKSAFITSLSIPMVPLLGSIVYQNRPRLFEVVGILIASFGMALMTLPPGKFEISRGDLLTLMCALTFALHIVVIGHFAPIHGFAPMAVIQTMVAAGLGIATFWFAEPVRFHFTLAVAGAVVATGLLATALAFTTMAWAQQYTSPTRTALIFALEPVVAWFTSYLLAGELLTNRAKIGAGLIFGGILLVEIRGAGKGGRNATQASEIASLIINGKEH